MHRGLAAARLVGSIAGLALLAPNGWADGPLEVSEVGFDCNTSYVSRGAIVAEQAAVQPTASLAVTNTPLAIDLWGSYVPSDRATSSEVDEFDVTMSAGLDRAIAGQSFAISGGVTRYHFPGAPAGARVSHELACSCEHQSALAPSVSYFYDFDLLNASYLQCSCCPELALNSSGTMSVCLSPAIAFGDLGQPFGFQDASLALSTGFEFGGLSLSPSIGYSYGSAAQNSDHHGVWSGLGVRFIHE